MSFFISRSTRNRSTLSTQPGILRCGRRAITECQLSYKELPFDLSLRNGRQVPASAITGLTARRRESYPFERLGWGALLSGSSGLHLPRRFWLIDECLARSRNLTIVAIPAASLPEQKMPFTGHALNGGSAKFEKSILAGRSVAGINEVPTKSSERQHRVSAKPCLPTIQLSKLHESEKCYLESRCLPG